MQIGTKNVFLCIYFYLSILHLFIINGIHFVPEKTYLNNFNCIFDMRNPSCYRLARQKHGELDLPCYQMELKMFSFKSRNRELVFFNQFTHTTPHHTTQYTRTLPFSLSHTHIYIFSRLSWNINCFKYCKLIKLLLNLKVHCNST